MWLRTHWAARPTGTMCQLCILLGRNPAPECYRTCHCSTSLSQQLWWVRSLLHKSHNKGMRHAKRRIWEDDPKVTCFHEDAEGTLWFKDRLVVPRRDTSKKKILDEAHMSRNSIHQGCTKMYHDLRQQFWWTRMKCETARYVSECDTC
jgi:hypothetical protein